MRIYNTTEEQLVDLVLTIVRVNKITVELATRLINELYANDKPAECSITGNLDMKPTIGMGKW